MSNIHYMLPRHLQVKNVDTACGNKVAPGTETHFLMTRVTCESCKQTEQFKKDLINFELIADGCVMLWAEYWLSGKSK